LLAQEKELYILAQSRQRPSVIRRRRLKKLWHRLAELRQMRLSRDQLLIRLGQAKEEAGRLVWRLVQVKVAQADNSLEPGVGRQRRPNFRARGVRGDRPGHAAIPTRRSLPLKPRPGRNENAPRDPR